MPDKPRHADGYPPRGRELAQSASLYLATRLGDLLDDLVIVGGIVPSLIIPQEFHDSSREPHVGTADLDLGLSLALLEGSRYQKLCQRLRQADFEPDTNSAGQPVSQRWRLKSTAHPITVDFLIPRSHATDQGGRLKNLEMGFAAIIIPGLELAFQDRTQVALEGTTPFGEQAKRSLWVCEAGAFTVLKAIAFRGRGEHKDAYDLVYVLLNDPRGVAEIARRIATLKPKSLVQEALEILRQDFTALEGVGTRRMADFLRDADNDSLRADAAGAVRALLRHLRDSP